MKKALKVLGMLLGVVILAIAGFATFIYLDWPVKKTPGSITVDAKPTPERLARGKKLVGMRCAGCHYDQNTGALTGIQMRDAPPAFGELYTHNITGHPQKGLGRYSDGELAYLLRTGIRKDGNFTGPMMASPHLGDEDLSSIIAFLRSDDPWVASRDIDDRQTKPGMLLKVLMHLAWKPMPVPKGPIAIPALTDKIAYGKYVAHGLGDCFACHSADFKSMNLEEPEKSGGYMGGGNQMRDASGRDIFTANITPDDTGIGKWTEDEFVRAVRMGIRKDGRALRYPMITFAELSEDEVRALYAYLMTVPKIHNEVPRNWDAPPPPSATEGEKLYVKYACASCHGNNGIGICDLRKASEKYPTDEKLNEYIHDAGKFVPGTKMPTWAGVIAENEYAPLIAYIHSLESKGGAQNAAGHP